MEDYAIYLAEIAKSDVVALHQFRLLYDPTEQAYHFFFEGEDDSLFYMPEARRYIGDNQAFIYNCGGKRSVVDIRETIKSDGYDTRYCLFFVDRDYDDLLGTQVDVDELTYITDGYSIENDVSSPCAARILLADVIRISRADPEFARIEAVLEAGFASFYRELRPLTGWILASKEAGLAPNLRNTVGLKGVVKVSGVAPELTKEGFVEFKKKVVVNGQTPSVRSVIKWTRILDVANPKQWVRGKYDIWFFQAILIAALDDTNARRRQSGARAIRLPGALREGRIFELLGGRAPVPASLEEFYVSRLN